MFEGLTFIGLLQKGGVTVVVLALLSVISIAVMLERAYAYTRFKRALDDVASRGRGGAVPAPGAPLGQVFASGAAKRGRTKAEVMDAMELAARQEISALDRFLGVLGTIGSTAPFIGLFGTVLGIIRAFSDLAIAEGASPAAVADGIAEALVATAAGLFVAVPAVMAYNYFVRAAGRNALKLEAVASDYADEVASETQTEAD